MAIQLRTLSEVLKYLMVQNKEYLMGQKGKPPIGRCMDCKRDILAMEMCATCPKCGEAKVCYKCVDRHDHITIENLIPQNPTTVTARPN